ncbi:Tetratricopeptide repeat protein 1 OS=Schizosaccharomyces pombe (strain 972 / ATCC 24843) GN=tpr1 PE=1 SV=1 [Rhizoctonia solani AG-1 IB]|uniref:Tetratricopeptide repeat protein 1 n=2 Tax=Thanatephorus cucumeris (strain AG1-IB / isolate 7/3/14) TaxID=1108050 RepID=A0A0B7FT07_THACB|nr:Tetratricopeptide repeat protein 1 OS=Schizosaccharomyces pombe (strain 972 / ATCC 24843) GN=tpr1 PE=1 SV=1 [Rhizoctonia solani AG-1 IB]
MAHRIIELELNSNETIQLNLDEITNPPSNGMDGEGVMMLLQEAKPQAWWKWSAIATEFARKGLKQEAEEIAKEAVTVLQPAQAASAHSLLALLRLDSARHAPKMLLSDARADQLPPQPTKGALVDQATEFVNAGQAAIVTDPEVSESVNTLFYLTKGIYQMARFSWVGAEKDFDIVLAKHSSNVIALMGKARILYARKQYREALKGFQECLTLNPKMLPDPRIGIGLCYWQLEHRERALAAWKRAEQVHPDSWYPGLLIGIHMMNISKDPKVPGQQRQDAFLDGVNRLTQAWRESGLNNASAATAMSDVFLLKGQLNKALKAAERTIQHADTLSVAVNGRLRAARVAHTEGNYDAALVHYRTAAEEPSHPLLADIGLAQMHVHIDELSAAIHDLDKLVQRNAGIEASAFLASLRALPRRALSATDAATEQAKAREIFDKVLRMVENGAGAGTGGVASDRDMYIEIARLWQKDNTDKATKALTQAVKLAGTPDARLINNVAVMRHMEGDLVAAKNGYEEAAMVGGGDSEDVVTTVLYNLGRLHEDLGDTTMAGEVFDKLLARHPEYVDATLRKAQLYMGAGRTSEAAALVKQASHTHSKDLNVRAFVSYFALSSDPVPVQDARAFVYTTLNLDRADVHALCVAAWINYHMAREGRTMPEPDKKKRYKNAIDLYKQALLNDPTCAVAAQGLAIMIAEDVTGSATTTGQPQEEARQREANLRDALGVFTRVRESLVDGSVYCNMGHCYFLRDEYDRALECYETASRRFYNGTNVSTLIHLTRTLYAKANRDQSFATMRQALSYAQRASHLAPTDKSIVYNIAMIEQKAAEMMFALPADKRTLLDLESAVQHAEHAQKLFGSLYMDPSPTTPYNRDVADQRRKYGDSMLRKAPEQLSNQKAYEAQINARRDAAKLKRLEETERVLEAERVAREAREREAERLRVDRQKAREEVEKWNVELAIKAESSDEERERKARRKREGEGGEKKKRKKIKREDDEGAAVFSDEELDDGTKDDKPKKPRVKKRVVQDAEDMDDDAANRKKKKVKSKATISDSDDE